MQSHESPFSAPSLTDPDYPGLVEALWSLAGGGPAAEAAGVVAVSEGLAEVLGWAARGQNADETAAVWIEQLRWAGALGLRPEDGAPVPPASWWETGVARQLARAGSDPRAEFPDLCRALVLGQMQYPARTELGDLDDAGFMDRLVPLAVHPRDSPAHLGQLAANLTCLTHGHPEAIATGLVWALLLRACLRRGAAATAGPEEPGGSRPEPIRVYELALDDVRALLGAADGPDGPDNDRPDDHRAPRTPQGLMARMAAGGGSVPALVRVLDSAPGTRKALRDADSGTAAALAPSATAPGPGPADETPSAGSGTAAAPSSPARMPDAPTVLALILAETRRACREAADSHGEAGRGRWNRAGHEDQAVGVVGPGRPDAVTRRAGLLAVCCGVPSPLPAAGGGLSGLIAESAARWVDAARRWSSA